MKLSLRDLFWLVLIVGMGIALWVAISTPCAILAAALTTGLLAIIYGRRTGRWWFKRRDWLAFYTVALLALAWSIDIFYMKHVIAQNTSDRHAAWTMELVQPTS